MTHVATERIYEPINDDGAAVLVYAEGAVVAEADVELYPDKVAPAEDGGAAEADEADTPDDKAKRGPKESDGFDGMTRDALVAYFNEHSPEGTTPLSKGSRKADALSAVRSLA